MVLYAKLTQLLLIIASVNVQGSVIPDQSLQRRRLGTGQKQCQAQCRNFLDSVGMMLPVPANPPHQSAYWRVAQNSYAGGSTTMAKKPFSIEGQRLEETDLPVSKPPGPSESMSGSHKEAAASTQSLSKSTSSVYQSFAEASSSKLSLPSSTESNDDQSFKTAASRQSSFKEHSPGLGLEAASTSANHVSKRSLKGIKRIWNRVKPKKRNPPVDKGEATAVEQKQESPVDKGKAKAVEPSSRTRIWYRYVSAPGIGCEVACMELCRTFFADCTGDELWGPQGQAPKGIEKKWKYPFF